MNLIQCNGCAEQWEEDKFLGASFSVMGEYESTHLKDLTRYRWRLCERCIFIQLINLRVPATESPYLPFEGCC